MRVRHVTVWHMGSGCICALLAFVLAAQAAPQAKITWLSDPVLPDDTVCVQGGDFGVPASVTIARIGDQSAAKPVEEKPQAAQVLESDDATVYFPVPASYTMGIYAVRVGDSATHYLNAPVVDWVEGDQGSRAMPGGWFMVMGRNFCFRNYGNGGLENAPEAKVQIQPEKGGDRVDLTLEKSTCFALRAKLPADLAEGTYSVYVSNGFGGEWGWRESPEKIVVQNHQWPTEVFDVKKLGSFEAALDAARENKGGIVHVPTGTFRLDPYFTKHVPPRTVIRGEGQNRSILLFDVKGIEDAPAAVFAGKDFAMEDLGLAVYGGFQNVFRLNDSNYFRMQRVLVRAIWYKRAWKHNQPGDIHFRGQTLWANPATNRVLVSMVRTRNNIITDCDLYIPETRFVHSRGHMKDSVIRNNHADGEVKFILFPTSRLILENNDHVGSLALGAEDRVYAADNQFSYYYEADEEAMTMDVGYVPYHGKVAQCDGTRLVTAGDAKSSTYLKDAKDAWKGMAVMVAGGRGAGQVRVVAANDKREFTLDRPWDVALDDTSYIYILTNRRDYIFENNRFVDSGSVQTYKVAINTVFYRNSLIRSSHLVQFAGWPQLFTQFLYNDIRDGGFRGTTGLTLFSTSHPSSEGSLPQFMADWAVVRGNTLERSHGIRLTEVENAIVEKNRLSNQERGIWVEKRKGSERPDAKHVLLRKNTFVNIEKPFEGNKIDDATKLDNEEVGQ